MGFYKNAGGIKEYTKEDIEDTDIPLNTFIIFKESESHEVILKCIERNDKNTCKDCFFKVLSECCPTCLPGERKDEKYALYQML